MTQPDYKAAQEFLIEDALIGHCGEMLTPDNVEKIIKEIVSRMRNGPIAWAFTMQES